MRKRGVPHYSPAKYYINNYSVRQLYLFLYKKSIFKRFGTGLLKLPYLFLNFFRNDDIIKMNRKYSNIKLFTGVVSYAIP